MAIKLKTTIPHAIKKAQREPSAFCRYRVRHSIIAQRVVVINTLRVCYVDRNEHFLDVNAIWISMYVCEGIAATAAYRHWTWWSGVCPYTATHRHATHRHTSHRHAHIDTLTLTLTLAHWHSHTGIHTHWLAPHRHTHIHWYNTDTHNTDTHCYLRFTTTCKKIPAAVPSTTGFGKHFLLSKHTIKISGMHYIKFRHVRENNNTYKNIATSLTYRDVVKLLQLLPCRYHALGSTFY